jgi:chromatin segregation and condensation protein Rec8/ScpA/Scc1 (kleisin family)
MAPDRSNVAKALVAAAARSRAEGRAHHRHLPPRPDPRERARPVDALLVSLPYDRSVTFRSSPASRTSSRSSCVLAILELFKQGLVGLAQTATFGDLVVRRLNDNERSIDLVSLDDWDDVPASVS